jgi:hypothetical protein
VGRNSSWRLKSLLTLSDVMSIGHHAAVSAGVKHGDTVRRHVNDETAS